MRYLYGFCVALVFFFSSSVFAYYDGDYVYVDVPACGDSAVQEGNFEYVSDALWDNNWIYFRNMEANQYVLYFYNPTSQWIIGEEGSNEASKYGSLEEYTDILGEYDGCDTFTVSLGSLRDPDVVLSEQVQNSSIAVIFGLAVLIFIFTLVFSGFVYNNFIKPSYD